MSDWKTIDEGGRGRAGDGPPVVLRGILATEPASYKRFYGGRKLTTFGFVIMALQRLIAWSFAGIVHLAAAAVLMTFYLEISQPDESVLFATLFKGDEPVEAEKKDDPAPAEVDVTPAMPATQPEEDATPPPIKVAKPVPLPPVPKPTPDPPKPDVNPSPDPIPAPSVNPAAKPATIGAGASASGGAPARGSISGSDISKDPGAALGRRRAGDLGILRGGSAQEIVVIKGVYDKTEKVLAKLGIPHRVVEAKDFPKADLSRARALLINCHQTYPPSKSQSSSSVASMKRKIEKLERTKDGLERMVNRTKDRRTLSRLKFELLTATSELASVKRTLDTATAMEEIREKVDAFVKDGGYVFTSDWGLSIVEAAFPGWIRNGGQVGPKTVMIQAPPKVRSEGMLEEVFYDPDAAEGSTVSLKKFQWKIDTNSFLIQRLKSGVEVLVDCDEIPKHSAVAVIFSPAGSDGGKILHILSHFQDQATQQGDYALQNLLLNFLLDRVRRGS